MNIMILNSIENQNDSKSQKKQGFSTIEKKIFGAFVEILKARKVNHLDVTILLSFNFLQIYGTIIGSDEFLEWRDDIIGGFITEFFIYVRITPMIVKYGSTLTLWFFYYICIFLFIIAIFIILCIIVAFIILIFVKNKKSYFISLVINGLNYIILYFIFVLYNPMIELFTVIMKCNEVNHAVDETLACKSARYYVIVSITSFLTFLILVLGLLITMLYKQSEPSIDDVLSNLENPLQMEGMFYRFFIFISLHFENEHLILFIAKYAVMIIFSIILIYQYLKTLPYFDNYTSNLYGYYIFMHAWTLLVSTLTFWVPFEGHFIMLVTGILPTYIMVTHIKTKLMERLIFENPEKIPNELEARMQCCVINFLISSKIDDQQRIILIGLINFIMKECEGNKVLYNLESLYDPSTNKLASEHNTESLHKNPVYLKHFVKRYFDIALENFSNSPGLRISYASFIFSTFRNVHASLAELMKAKSNNPNLMQTFDIFKFEYYYK